MSFKLHELKDDSEFGPLVIVQNEAYTVPFNGFWEVLKGPSLDEWQTRQALWHNHDPSSRWTYATDKETGDIVGGLAWNIHKSNPYAEGVPEVKADWWPEGSAMKTIGDEVFAQFFGGRPPFMSQPHFLINYCFVNPKYRHKGVASMLIKWGLDQADSLGLETFVESTEDGEGFYAAHGFQVIKELNLDVDVPEPSTEFTRLKERILPVHGWVMKRFVGGKKA